MSQCQCKFDQDLSTEVVYKINCKDCEKVSIGQTSRALRSRTKEHKRAVFTGDKNSLLAQHCMQNNHEFDFEGVRIVDRCPQWSRRLFFGSVALHSRTDSINEHMHIPKMYKVLAKEGYSILTETTIFTNF